MCARKWGRTGQGGKETTRLMTGDSYALASKRKHRASQDAVMQKATEDGRWEVQARGPSIHLGAPEDTLPQTKGQAEGRERGTWTKGWEEAFTLGQTQVCESEPPVYDTLLAPLLVSPGVQWASQPPPPQPWPQRSVILLD